MASRRFLTGAAAALSRRVSAKALGPTGSLHQLPSSTPFCSPPTLDRLINKEVCYGGTFGLYRTSSSRSGDPMRSYLERYAKIWGNSSKEITNTEMREFRTRQEARDEMKLNQSAEQFALADKHAKLVEMELSILRKSLEKPVGFEAFLRGFFARLPDKGPWRNAFLACAGLSALLAFSVAITTLMDFVSKHK